MVWLGPLRVTGLCQVAFLLAAVAAHADTFSWRIGSGQAREATAALFASNALTAGSRAIDYYPVLTVSCRAGREPVWRQSVRVRDPLSNAAATDVGIRLDGGREVRENWSLGQKNRALVLDGEAGVARMIGAQRLRVVWRIGLFSGDGEAVFNLAGIRAAVSALAETCGVAPPSR